MATAAPRIWDFQDDEYRPVTQADIDMLLQVQVAYGKLRRDVETTHADLMARIADIRSNAGLPHAPENGA